MKIITWRIELFVKVVIIRMEEKTIIGTPYSKINNEISIIRKSMTTALVFHMKTIAIKQIQITKT